MGPTGETGPMGPTGPTGPTGPQGDTGPTFTDWRAGTGTITSGNASVTVSFSSAMSSTSYAAVVEITNSPSIGSPVILQASGKTVNGFTITLVDPTTGSSVTAPTGGVTVNWIAMPYN